MNEDTSVLHYGQIEELAKQKYLDYAMSVITSRALPDVRDGLKPVQRRILYSMNLLGAGHKAAYKKSARIVGDVIGKYHPHGDSSVYEAMVRTAQPFSMRMLLIDGQGNFGSVDGDSAAAMRYTEARLHKFGEAMFGDIHLNTVDMQPNYDGSEQEPTVLPVAYPNLLINGVQGIAVGMASNIPPHNPIEIMEAVKYLIQCRQNQTQASLDELVSMVPSPDFPTGGLVHGTNSMREAWEFGRAKMKLRAKWKEEKVDNRTVIAVTELPYQVNKERLRKKIQDLASPITEKDHPNFGKPEIDGIYEVIDESDKSGIRLAIYLKHGHDANIVFNRLLQLTELETSISYNTTVIVKGEPKLIGLKDVLEHFIEHRNEIILRRTQTLYAKNLAREKILDGLMRAVDPQNLDKVISIVRSNRETAQAKEQIIEFLHVDETQATAILELSLKRLTGLEIDAMREELEQKRLQNIQYREIIDSQQKRYEIMIEESNAQIEEFRSSKEDLGRYWTQLPYSKRLTDFTQETLETNLGSLIKEEESVILYSQGGYVRRSALEDFREQRRGTRGSRKFDLKDGDFIINTITAFSHDAIMFITESGRAFSLLAYEVPTGNSGTHINNLLLGKDKKDLVVKVLPIQFDADQELTIITQNGLVKRGTVDSLKTSQYSRGIGAINLSEGDRVFDAHITNTNSDLMFFKADNSVSRTPISKFSMKKGRLTSGVLGTKMTDKLVGVINADGSNEEGIVATISEQGLIKLTHIGEYRQTARNTKGVKAFKESGRSGKLINASYVPSLDSDIVTVTKNGIVNRISLEKVRVSSRTTTGVKLIEVSPGDEIASVFVVEKDGEE